MVDTIAEASVEDGAWRSGPPKATLARRTQSHSDFYEVATSQTRKANASMSSGESSSRVAQPRGKAELDFDAEFTSLEDRLIEESYAGYQTYYEQLLLSESHLDHLLLSTSDTLNLLYEL